MGSLESTYKGSDNTEEPNCRLCEQFEEVATLTIFKCEKLVVKKNSLRCLGYQIIRIPIPHQTNSGVQGEKRILTFSHYLQFHNGGGEHLLQNMLYNISKLCIACECVICPKNNFKQI